MSYRLSRIVTKTGDDGSTGLADGTRVSKHSNRITALGDIDELNSMLGVIIAHSLPDDLSQQLLQIQHCLFDIGGELAIPDTTKIQADCVEDLQKWIQSYNAELPALKEFILPGGNMPGSMCHLARAVCRRAERSLVRLAVDEHVNPNSVAYINRLSDLLFVVARTLVLNNGCEEVYWKNDSAREAPE